MAITQRSILSTCVITGQIANNARASVRPAPVASADPAPASDNCGVTFGLPGDLATARAEVVQQPADYISFAGIYG